MQAMEYIGLHEDKISLADIIKYLSLLKGNMDELNLLEFKTIKGWLVGLFFVISSFVVYTLCNHFINNRSFIRKYR